MDLIREYLSNVEGMKDEVKELELLASQLTLSHTPKEVCALRHHKPTHAHTCTNPCTYLMYVHVCKLRASIYMYVQVDDVQTLLENFTSLSIQKRE